MPAIRMSREQWDKLVASFREKPGNIAAAARAAGVMPRSATTAYRRGYSKPAWAERPIKELIDEEQYATRAKLQLERDLENQVANAHQASLAQRTLEADAERELAKRDAASQTANEARAVRAAMTHGMAILGLAGQLGQATLPLVEKAARMMKSEQPADAKAVLELVTKIAWLGQSSVNVVGRAMELERLRLGKPEHITGVATVGSVGVDVTRAVDLLGSEKEVEAAVRDLLDGNMTQRALRLLEAHPQAPGKASVN